MNEHHPVQDESGKEQCNAKMYVHCQIAFFHVLDGSFDKGFHSHIKSWYCSCLESLEKKGHGRKVKLW